MMIIKNRRITLYFVLAFGLFFMFSLYFGGTARAADIFPETISGGENYTCGIKTDRNVVCWGDSYGGRTAPPAGNFIQISATYVHVCGVKLDGSIACWGDNGHGRADSPIGTFLQVSAGHFHSCGVKTDGSVACWGDNADGQATSPIGNFRQVTTGAFHSCGVKTDGNVACWGDNTYGQATSPIGAFRQISAGAQHNCGVRTDGSIDCWGDNVYGQASPPIGSFRQVSAGIRHTCGVKTDSTIACWGDNTYGQVTSPTGTFRQVAAGFWHTCGTKMDGAVVCWGIHEHGEADPPAGLIVALYGPLTPTLSIASISRNLSHGQNSFTVPIQFMYNAANIAALSFTLSYDQTCLNFDSSTDTNNDGIPDSLSNLPDGFDLSFEHNTVNGALKFLIKPLTVVPPLPALLDINIAQLTFGVQPSCMTNDGTPKSVNFSFSDYSFGTAQGVSLTGNAIDGVYALYFNVVPSAITLTNTTVDENLSIGTTVGVISSTPGDGETYTLVDGAGDNANFAISGDLLKTAASFNFESKNSYTVRIRTTDTYSNTFEKDFNITINDRNDAPVAHDDVTDPPLLVIGDGNPVVINVLANDTDEDAGDTLTVAAVTQGPHGATVQNNSNNVSYTAPTHYNGADSFSYTAQDQGGLTANATASLYTIANDARGDCNGDSLINAADFPSLILEIFDTDVAQSWWRSAEQGFHGSPRGCDANASQNGQSHDQASVDAADIICTVLVFFGHTSCTNGQVLAAHTGTSAMLSVASPPAAAPGQTVAVPLTLNTAGNRVAAATFALTFDPAYLSFDSSDADNDGVPDAILLHIPANLSVSANYNASQHRLEVALFSLALPMPLLTDGALATVTLHVTNTAMVATTPLTLSLVSLGDDQGQNVPVNAKDGLLQIGNSAFLPVIQR